jgi:hypothetical protein
LPQYGLIIDGYTTQIGKPSMDFRSANGAPINQRLFLVFVPCCVPISVTACVVKAHVQPIRPNMVRSRPITHLRWFRLCR